MNRVLLFLRKYCGIFCLILLMWGGNAFGQFNINASAANYTENFNSLTGTVWADNSTLTGWYARTDVNATISIYGANTGSTTTAGLYSYGILGASPLSDKAIGFAPSNAFTGVTGTGKGYIGWRLKNNTGADITSITVTWSGEQWRKDNIVNQALTFDYQKAATITDLISGSWTNVPALTFTSPIITSGASALDGNATANRTSSISTTITVSVLAGEEVMLRWVDLNDSGNDHYLAIDDVTVNVATAPSGFTSITSGAWDNPQTWNPTGTALPTATDNVTISTGHTVHTTTSLTRTASTTVNGTFELRNNGFADGTNFTYGAAGTLNFNTTGIYGVADTHVYWPATSGPVNVNVLRDFTNGAPAGFRLNSAPRAIPTTGTLSVRGADAANLGVVQLSSSVLTINGKLQIKSSGTIDNPPTYTSTSTLEYNNVNPYTVFNEWNNGAFVVGSGVPQNVTLINSIVNMPAAVRGMAGNLTIDANSTLNHVSAAVILIAGNWSNAGVFNSNNGVVSFRGSANPQTITNTNLSSSSTENFSTLIVGKPSGNTLRLESNININGTIGNVLRILDVGQLNLNGKVLSLNNDGGDIFVDANRTITSSVPNGRININGQKTISNNAVGQTLTLNTNVTVNLNTNGVLDFGKSGGSEITILNGTLSINSNTNCFVNFNPPIYGSASTLVYNTPTYNVALEWTGNASVAEAGTPQNVTLTNSAITMPTAVRSLAGNLNIGLNSTLSMTSTFGADLQIGGNFTNSGTFNPTNRAVIFNGGNAQTITGATTFDYLTINKSGGTNVTLAATIIVNKNLVLTAGNIILGSNNLTLPNNISTVTASAISYITASGNGKFIRQGIDGSGDWLFPVGVANSGRYAPIIFKNLPGTRQIGVSVTETFSPLIANPSQALKTQWIVSADIATNPVSIATGWQSADLGPSMSFTPPALGEIGIAYGTLPYTSYDASLNSNSTEVNALSLAAGNNAVAVGLKNAIKLPNDECANAITLTVNPGTSCTVTTPGNLLSASQSIAPVNCASNTSSTALDIWYKFTATSVSHIISVTPTSSFDAVVDVRSGGCNGTNIGCADAFGSTTNAEKVTLNTLTVGVDYYVRVYEYNGTATTSKPFIVCVTQGLIPTITMTGTPILFSYAQGQGPSANQSVVVSGQNLASDISVTVPSTNWEISTTAAFTTPALPNTSSSIILNKNASNAVGNNTIYIRLKAGLAEGDYDLVTTDELKVTSTNASTKTANLNGKVTAPVAVINVEGNIGSFPDITPVTNTPLGTDNTLFGQQTIGNVQTKSFRIQNLGGLPLTVSNITISGANNADFSVTNPPSYPLVIAPNSVVTFEVTFNPLAIGQRDAIISIANNSNNISPQFSFNVRGTGNNAEIDITGNGTLIPTGNTIISAADFTLIGSANGSATNPTTVSKNFIIKNFGNVPLSISGITIIGADSNQFSVSPTTATIAAGASRTITVTFAPTSFGVKNAVINIANNDVTENENPYTFAVQGKGVNFVVCATGEQIIYQTGFESSEGFVLNTFNSNPYYQDTNYSTGGATTKWVTTYGTPTTSQPRINGGQSMQMRLYTNGEIGSTYTNFNLSDVKRVEFLAQSKDGILSVEVSHSLNNGTTWILPEVFPLSDMVQSFVYNVNSTPGSNVRIKFKVVGIPPDSDSKKLVIDDVVIYKGFENVKTWDGNAWSGAGNTLAPTASQKAIITGTYNSAANGGDIKACECEVTAAGSVTMNAGHTLDIQGAINNNGTISILDSGSLVQRDDSAINAGSINMERISKQMLREDYTYWSSPVQNFPLKNVSPGTSDSKFFKWKEDTQVWSAINAPSAHNMQAGRGYIVRAPSNFPVSGTPLFHTANFIGVPNNGIVTMTVKGSVPAVGDDPTGPDTQGDNYQWNLIGNPYPSAIDADIFMSSNSSFVAGTLYLWTHNTPLNPSTVLGYAPNDYASWNGTGGVDTKPAGSTGVSTGTPNGYIAAGQSFFIRGITAGMSTVTFNNSMRVDGSAGKNSQFFRTATETAENPTTTEKHRVWLNLTGAQNAFNQTLVGYVTDATNAYDLRFDGESFGGNKVTFYSVLDTKNLVIQGRALPFSNLDTVPLGYNTTLTGNLTISIDHVDGLMETQGIYLQDNLLNVVHDLKASNYTFATVPGTFDSRFVLRYSPQEDLSNPTFNDQVKAVKIYKNKTALYANSPYEEIATVSVYDIAGRLIFEERNCNTNRFETTKINAGNQALIIKVTLSNGAVITQKVL